MRNLFRDSRAQAQVITTVLIILLVLAIIGVVAVMVNNTVKRGSQEAEERAQCINIDLSITKITASSVSVTRGAGGGEDITIDNVKVLINGKSMETLLIAGDDNMLGPLESGTVNIDPSVTILDGEEVEIAPVLSTGVVCGVTDKMTYTA